jgi:LPXTG-motif cell wall-anchored protein
MKKIIGIILAVLMMFSMSTAAFAGFTTAPKADTTKVETVTVTVTLEPDFTPTSKLALFEKYENPYAENEEEANVTIEGRIFKIKFAIFNGTEDVIYVNDVLDGFYLSVTDTATEKPVKHWEKAKDFGFGGRDLSKMAINPNESGGVIYKDYVITDKSVTIKAVYEEVAKNIEEKAVFDLVVAPVAPVETTTVPAETTTEAPAETTTTTTTEAPAVEPTEAPTEPTEAPTEAPEIDYEIPDTGSSKMIGAVSALGVAAIAALVISKKKKSNEENWT